MKKLPRLMKNEIKIRFNKKVKNYASVSPRKYFNNLNFLEGYLSRTSCCCHSILWNNQLLFQRLLPSGEYKKSSTRLCLIEENLHWGRVWPIVNNGFLLSNSSSFTDVISIDKIRTQDLSHHWESHLYIGRFKKVDAHI